MANNFPLIISKHLWLDQLCLSFFISVSVLLIIPVLLILFTRNANKRSSSSSGRKSLNLPPSPPRLPVIGNLHQLGKFPHRSLRALSEKYGPLMLLHLGQAAPTLVVSSPDLVKEIAKNHDTTFSNRPQTTATDILFYGGKDMAFSPYGESWRQARRICAVQLLCLKRVQSFQSIREEEVTKMVERLRKASLNIGDSTNSVNLSEILISTSNNIVSRCVLGENYDTEEGGGSRLGELGRKALVQFLAFSVADFFPSLRWIDVLRGFIASLKSTSRALDAIYSEVIEEHKAIFTSSPKDFVDILLQLQKDHSMVNFELTNIHIKAIIQDMLVGGIETTSTLMEWLMSELMNNPRVMKRAQEEVRRVVGEKAMVEINDIHRMDYLKCVIREALRLHPPGTLLIPRETSRSVEIRGYHIPAGTKVLVNAWAIHRHPDFWDEPEEFIPERFENSPVDFKSQECFELIPFGFGRRQCPGIAFGVTSTEYVIANLLYWFDWKLPT
ncbi:cytochrome P450 71A1, partial [Morus notabilis]|uniref:cytochrome P450 71A1 n=1 Tax=Morus notabilis TaxID=981085 RepID=UPI000CED515C